MGRPQANQSRGPGAEKRPLLQPAWPANCTLVWVFFAARGAFGSGTHAWGRLVNRRGREQRLVFAAANESAILIPHLLDAERRERHGKTQIGDLDERLFCKRYVTLRTLLGPFNITKHGRTSPKTSMGPVDVAF